MMTVSEAERARRAAEKGRSASFCATGQLPLTLAAAHSSTDVCEGSATTGPEIDFFMQAVNGSAAQQSPRTKLKASQSARRSQSCRVQGSRPPRATRRHETPRGSAAGLDQSTDSHLEYQGTPPPEGTEGGSYNPFLKKVGSCGRLVTLAPDDEAEGSPTLQRSASARRPRPPISPTHSPTPTRVTRATGSSSSIKGRAPCRKGGTPTSGSSRRVVHSGGGYLEVRGSGSAETLDPEACVLRNFSTTHKGIVNRGDSFRRRRSRSNSIQPPYEAPSLPSVPPQVGDIPSIPASPELRDFKETPHESTCTEHFRMAVVGAPGVGKTALMNQFRTSDCINAYDCSGVDNQEESVSIVLNNIESEIVFVNITSPGDLQDEMQRVPSPSGWLLIFSVTDKSSFQRAKEDLTKLQVASLLKGRVAIVVGNKCELVRSRTVSFEDGRDLACSFSAKFMEISVGMNHKCDDLLVGILNQLRLKEEASAASTAEGGTGAGGEKEKSTWTRNRSLMRASMKAKKLVNRIIGKSDSKHKECEDFLN